MPPPPRLLTSLFPSLLPGLLPRLRPPLLAALAALTLAGCGPRAAAPALAPAAPFRERLAALALRQTAFGALSVIPVRFERSRVSKPFVEEGRTLYCVSTRMMGRSFGEPERPKVVVQEAANVLTIVDEDETICEGHRTEPFPELDTPVAART